MSRIIEKALIVTLEDLVQVAQPHLRQIVWHSDGRVVAKSGARAPKPKKLYNGSTAREAVAKLIDDNFESNVGK